jgi:hypothetical protein
MASRYFAIEYFNRGLCELPLVWMATSREAVWKTFRSSLPPEAKDPSFNVFCYEVEWDTYNAFVERRSYWYELLRRDWRAEREKEVARDKEKPFLGPDDSLLTLVLKVIGFIIGLGIIIGANPFNIWQ